MEKEDVTHFSQRVLLALPDAFVNPRTWAQHSALLEETLSEYINSRNSIASVEQNTQSLDQTFVDAFTDLRRRNDAMLFRDLPPRIVGHLSSALADIKVCCRYKVNVLFALSGCLVFELIIWTI